MITRAALERAGCTCFNGKAFDARGEKAAFAINGIDDRWAPFGPQEFGMQLLHEYGASGFNPRNPKPTFRVKATTEKE